MNNSGIRPLDLRVLVSVVEMDERTAGGVLIPETVRDKEKYASTRATVLAIGKNAFKDWSDEEPPKVGDVITMAKYAGVNIKGEDGKEYRMVNDGDITGVVQ